MVIEVSPTFMTSKPSVCSCATACAVMPSSERNRRTVSRVMGAADANSDVPSIERGDASAYTTGGTFLAALLVVVALAMVLLFSAWRSIEYVCSLRKGHGLDEVPNLLRHAGLARDAHHGLPRSGLGVHVHV